MKLISLGCENPNADIEHRTHEKIMVILANGENLDHVASYLLEAEEYVYYCQHVRQILRQIN